MNVQKEIRFIDLFAGIGGFRLGLEKSNNRGKPSVSKGRNENSGSPQNLQHQGSQPRDEKPDFSFKCVWSNDFNKYANQIYTKRFGEENHHPGDITRIGAEEIPSHDLLCGGFPCQAFSVAGKRRGFEETRGTLFFEICRIAEAHRPSLLLLENVKGLLSHDGGRTFATILNTLEELGYWWEYQVLNSKHFGVPQNRERVFIIGHSRNGCTESIFPITESSELLDQANRGKQEGWPGLRGSLSPTIDARYGALRNAGEMYIIADRTRNLAGKGRNLESPKPITNSLTAVPKDNLLLTEPYIKNIPHGHNDGWEKPLPNLKANSGAQYNELLVKDAKIRRLTPVECERLQGFPDNWTEGISETQRYKCLGNAVTVNVIEYLGNQIRTKLSLCAEEEK